MNETEIRERVAEIDWWHDIDLGNGIVTPGKGGSRARLRRIRLPENLTGRSVLDIGTFDGMFAFEAERRHASRVVALDDWKHPGFELAHEVLDSNVEFVQMDVREMSAERPGVFDLVLFMGVLYHLPDPMTALERVAAVTSEHCILESATAANWTHLPVAEFRATSQAWKDSRMDWWFPNLACLEAMLRSVGFSRVEPVYPKLKERGRLARSLQRAMPGVLGPRAGRAVVHAWK